MVAMVVLVVALVSVGVMVSDVLAGGMVAVLAGVDDGSGGSGGGSGGNGGGGGSCSAGTVPVAEMVAVVAKQRQTWSFCRQTLSYINTNRYMAGRRVGE